MIDEKEYIRLKEKNRKLKAKVWNDYRNYSDELRMLKHQNRSLQNSIKLEQNKNRELFQHFSNKISQLQEQLRQVSFETSSFTPSFSTPKNKRKKDNFQWRFQELEEEGKALQADTEKTFKKCRESSPLNIWLRDIPPPVTSYSFNYTPIVISPPQPSRNQQECFYFNDDQSSSSSYSNQNELQVSPIVSSHDKHKPKLTSKKQENYSSNSSTISVKQNSNKYNSDSDDYDIPPSVQYMPNNNNLNTNIDENDKKNCTKNNNVNRQKSDQNQLSSQNLTQNSRFPPQSLQVGSNQPLNYGNTNQQKETLNSSKLPSPIHIKTHIDDESDTDKTEPYNPQISQITQTSLTQQPKKQSEVQIIKPKVTDPNMTLAGFMSQSNWDVDVDNEEVVIDVEEIVDDGKNEKVDSNNMKKNILSGGIQSDTNPILDTSDHTQPNSFQQQKQENENEKSPQSSSPKSTKASSQKISLPGSPTSKNDFDFELEINDDLWS